MAKPLEPSPRDKIVLALMELANTVDWQEISLPMIAEKSGVTLLEMRDYFPSKGAILGGFARIVDRKVLDGTTADMQDEPIRDRLLDIMLRRFDVLEPYKAAIRNIRDHMRFDLLSLAALNSVSLNSWRYMLAAAGINTEDKLGPMRIQGAALIFARSLDTWMSDDTPGREKTMAVLDAKLKRGEEAIARMEEMERLLSPFCGMMRRVLERRGSGRKPSPENDIAAGI